MDTSLFVHSVPSPYVYDTWRFTGGLYCTSRDTWDGAWYQLDLHSDAFGQRPMLQAGQHTLLQSMGGIGIVSSSNRGGSPDSKPSCLLLATSFGCRILRMARRLLSTVSMPTTYIFG
jgi:hypothetical protein